MAIVNAVQRGSAVCVYDETGRQILTLPAGFGPKDGLVGYTSKTVSIRRGNAVYTHDEKGRQITVTMAQ